MKAGTKSGFGGEVVGVGAQHPGHLRPCREGGHHKRHEGGAILLAAFPDVLTSPTV